MNRAAASSLPSSAISTTFTRLVREFHDIFSSANSNLECTDWYQVAQEYRNCVLTALEVATPDSEELERLWEFDLIWGLSMLCLFKTLMETPVSFVHGYIRWVQFHFAGKHWNIFRIILA